SKRLFYVACTRAKKKLIWVSLDIPEKCFSIPENSWIDGLNYWFTQHFKAEDATSVRVTELQDFDYRSLLETNSRPQLPLFFYDSVGVFPKGEGLSELALAAELSVTRLNALIDCPRKFYFQNVLKIQGQENVFSADYAPSDETEELA